MRRINAQWLALIVLLMLAVVAAGPAVPAAATKSYSFNLTKSGDSAAFDFKVSEAGCIVAQVNSWSASTKSERAASQLSLSLNGSDRTKAYAQESGGFSNAAPLWTSYSVSSAELSRVKTWTILVENSRDTAKGTLNLEYPSTRVPCELAATASSTAGKVGLSWVYTGRNFRGSFLVERSTDGRRWEVVKGCELSSSAKAGYSCSDSGLRSRSTYYYRACAVTTSGSKCASTDVSPATSVTTR